MLLKQSDFPSLFFEEMKCGINNQTAIIPYSSQPLLLNKKYHKVFKISTIFMGLLKAIPYPSCIMQV